ncbi:DM13 domain-containing protein [Terasakiella sp. A23]|uniref:DM13 domain-containing protein n=1 Tax=Terasakiella sp. FCG-A23 TaxID=3080561 RepID=UPI00295583DC|nr:DM13 domain-containing protein [Terasakiella sp. A23]MDV7341201.1 DM13 domain-containing protein [Terasakiella sp. A23]
MRKILFFGISHAAVLFFGFALGIYMLPILTAPNSPDVTKLEQMSTDAKFSAHFSRDLRGSDFLHWGDGTISFTSDKILHKGSLAPGPDYKLYLVKEFVEHEEEFLPIKGDAKVIGDIKTFEGFILDLPEDVNLEDYTTVVIWCESFSEFITAAKYR